MHNILDPLFNGMGGSEMYRAQVLPDLFPGKPMLVENWSDLDREMYCGSTESKVNDREPSRLA